MLTAEKANRPVDRLVKPSRPLPTIKAGQTFREKGSHDIVESCKRVARRSTREKAKPKENVGKHVRRTCYRDSNFVSSHVHLAATWPRLLSICTKSSIFLPSYSDAFPFRLVLLDIAPVEHCPCHDTWDRHSLCTHLVLRSCHRVELTSTFLRSW